MKLGKRLVMVSHAQFEHAGILSCVILFPFPVAGPPPEGECPSFSVASVTNLLPDRCEAKANRDTTKWGGEYPGCGFP